MKRIGQIVQYFAVACLLVVPLRSAAEGEVPPAATVTSTATPSVSPSITPTTTRTVVVQAPFRASAGDLSSTVSVFYGGNSDGRLKDAGGRGPDLMMVGVPPWGYDPAPPEGDRWLFGSVTATGTSAGFYFAVSPTAWPMQGEKFVGSVFFYLFYAAPGNVRTPLFNVRSPDEKRYLSLEVGLTKPVFILEWSSAYGKPNNIVPYHGMEPGTLHTVVVVCHEDGVDLLLDGHSLGCIPEPVELVAADVSHLGLRGDGTQATYNYFVDGFGISSDPYEKWPGLPVSPLKTKTSRR